jgi:hypothetical protein
MSFFKQLAGYTNALKFIEIIVMNLLLYIDYLSVHKVKRHKYCLNLKIQFHYPFIRYF